MLPEDPKEVLALWGRTKAPHDLARERNWRALTGRIQAGDLGPALAAARGGGRSATVVKLAAATLVASVMIAGGVWLLRMRGEPHAARVSALTPPELRPARDEGAAALSHLGRLSPRSETTAAAGVCRGLDRPYTDPAELEVRPGDPRASVAQPWRGWLETLPVSALTGGLGALVNQGELRGLDPDVAVAALARNGVRHVLFELAWAHLSYDSETFEARGVRHVTALLAACKRHGVRPTIRIVSHESVPCPLLRLRRKVGLAARAGDRTLILDDARDLVPGRSGLSRMVGDVAAEILVTEVRGQTVSLSKPLPHDLAAGTHVTIDTLKYRPFGAPGTADFDATMRGWKRYVDAVGDLAMRELGTAHAEDKGFDLELWNAVTFASSFLFLGRYHDPPGPAADDDRAWRQLAVETARHLSANPDRFRAVRLINGLATHTRDVACAELPAPFAGLRRATPGALSRPLLQDPDGSTSDPMLWPMPGTRTRTLRLVFPEIEATALTPDSYVQDLAPRRRGGTSAGAPGARLPSCGVWVSGAGPDTRGFAPLATSERAQALKAKMLLRQATFLLGKGARRVTVAAAPDAQSEDDRGYGLLSLAYLQRARASGSGSALAEDAHRTSPALAAFGRMVAVAGDGADADIGLRRLRSIEVRALSDCHDHVQFRGGPADPVLWNRDVFVALPFQAAARRFVIPYYVMTRDVTADLPPERYTITLGGLGAPDSRVRAYDPVKDRDVPVHLERVEGDQLTISVEAVDYPRLLIVEE